MSARPASGWSRRALVVVIGHAVLLQLVTLCFRPTLSYAALDAGLDTGALGLLSAAFAVPGLLLAIPMGRLADRWGERRILVLGGVVFLTGPVIAWFGVDSIGALVVATAVYGIGHLTSVVGEQALLANRTSGTSRDGVFGMYAFAISLGQGAGGALLSINATDSAAPDIPLQLVLSIVLATVLLVASAALRSTRRSVTGTGAIPIAPQGTVALLRNPGVARAIFASALVVTSIEISVVYFPAVGVERGFTAATVSAMLVARSIAGMVSRIGLTTMVRVIGRRRVMVGGIGISAVAFAAIALPLDPVWLIALCVLFGFANGVCQPLTLSWLSEVAPRGQRGTVMSIRIAGVRVAQAAMPLTVGALSVVSGAGGVLVATGALVGVAAWASSAIGRTPPPDDAPDAVGEAA